MMNKKLVKTGAACTCFSYYSSSINAYSSSC